MVKFLEKLFNVKPLFEVVGAAPSRQQLQLALDSLSSRFDEAQAQAEALNQRLDEAEVVIYNATVSMLEYLMLHPE